MFTCNCFVVVDAKSYARSTENNPLFAAKPLFEDHSTVHLATVDVILWTIISNLNVALGALGELALKTRGIANMLTASSNVGSVVPTYSTFVFTRPAPAL
jgi:hypothetical protein